MVGKDFSRRGWSMPINMIQHALFCFLNTDSTVMVGDRFYTLGGLAMGLVLSGICLSLNMVQVEWTSREEKHNDPSFRSRFPVDNFGVTSLRYVDDLISVSSQLCGKCLTNYLLELYPWNISFSGISNQQTATHCYEWLNFKIFFRLTSCRVGRSSPNWDWVWNGGPRKRFSIIPWCGCHTVQLMHMRSYYICEIKAVATMRIPLHFQILHLLTIIIEFFLLGYPKKFIIGMTICNHSVAAQTCSTLMRSFLAFL